MTRRSWSRVWALALLLGVAANARVTQRAVAQTDQTAESQLIGKARALESRGRADLAKQVWQQVLNGNRNQPDALAGMARASKLEGNQREAQGYLDRLRTVRPGDPDLARIDAMGTEQDQTAKLQEAGRLSQSGQYARAMAIFREVYGTNPPAGGPALSYYQTEAATEDGRPHAVAGLRALADRFPNDPRYDLALGKILTYNPRTRAEGRRLLEKHKDEPDAQQALRAAQNWDRSNGSSESRASGLSLSASSPMAPPGQSMIQRPYSYGAGVHSPFAMQPGGARMNSDEQHAYTALNAGRLQEADRFFRGLLDKNRRNAHAAAGLGYVRMKQGNFGGAISFFEQAEQDGHADRGLEKALDDSRFFYLMQTATAALNGNKLQVAEQEFREALRKRPDDPQALQGLGGTMLKAQQNENAIAIFLTLVRLAPGDPAAWRGLVMAQAGAGRYAEAIGTEGRVPPKVRAELQRDPEYLRTLAITYNALGRDVDAQRVLSLALNLPFPPNGEGLKPEEQMQYAALLSIAGRKQQAIGLYRQVLTREHNNVNAWIGLVQNQHQAGNDAAAYQTIRMMPPESYRAAMQEAGFETTLAAVYQAQGNDELAQKMLEQFLAGQRAQGKQPFAPAQLQLAGLYLRRGDSTQAYALYRELIAGNQHNAEAWSGLVGALHATGHNQEALAQLQTVPPDVRSELESNPTFLVTLGSIYASTGNLNGAVQYSKRVQEYYGRTRIRPPADLEVQEAWLLYNTHSDQALLTHLLRLGDRKDLTDQQRSTLQAIWANFALRRANEASGAGDYRRAVAILNAAAQTFPNNPDVLRALAGGYAAAGQPKEAVAIFKTLDMRKAPRADYRAAVGSALAANDLRDAELWLRFGLDQNPRDPQMMILAAKFETQRGDTKRAADYYKAALAVIPPGAPDSTLAAEISHPAPVTEGGLAGWTQQRSLADLLSQPEPRRRQTNEPYLPSYSDGAGPTGTVGPDMGGYAPAVPQAQPPVAPARPSGTLKDYKPQASVRPLRELHLHPDKRVEARYGPYLAYDPADGVRQFVGANHELGDGVVTSETAKTPAIARNAAFKQQTQSPDPGPPSKPSPQNRPIDGTGQQQYPQPGTQGGSLPARRNAQPVKRKPTSKPEAVPAPSVPENPEQYPAYSQPAVQPSEISNPSQNTDVYAPVQVPNDDRLQQHNLPPLRGYYDPRPEARPSLTDRQIAEMGLAQITGSYSGWAGGTAAGRYRSGTPGLDRLTTLKVPFEASFMMGNRFRFSIVPQAVFLNSGQLNTGGGTLSTGPVLGTYLGAAPNNPVQQFASGIGFEAQLAAKTFAVAVGSTPYEFLVSNFIGRGRWRPGNGHFTLYGGRDAVEETQLAYAGMRDPGSATTSYGGTVWGGVVQTGGGVRFDFGDEGSGLYLQGEGATLTGQHVLQNQKYAGLAGIYFGLKKWPQAGALNIGGLFYGMHFTYNERGETYGLGGYFSPNTYFLAAVPVTFNGHHGTDLHYTVSGSLGVQTFEEENTTFFPLDPGLLAVAGCTNAQLLSHTCGLPANSNTGLNFSFDSEVSYRATNHWFVGGFLNANNTNNFDAVTGGFFARYTFRTQVSDGASPTGLFPVQGLRPLRVP